MTSKGFTLIELAVVIAIIAVLAGILSPLVTDQLEQARTTRAIVETRMIADAIRMYQRDTGKAPIFSSTTDTTPDAEFLVGPGNELPGGVVGTTSGLVTYLTTNVANFDTTGKLTNAAYRGPYLGSLNPDPWAHNYVVTGTELAGTTNWAFVISAGPDGEVTTDLTQAKSAGLFATDGDDVGAVIK